MSEEYSANNQMANGNTKRKTPKGALFALIGLGFILAVVGLLYSPDSDSVSEALIGTEAVDFNFQLPNSPQKSLMDFRGKVVLINFWAYWCEPCLKEMPSLKKLEETMKGKDFVLLMVHVGDEIDEAMKVPQLPSQLVFDIPAATLSSYGVSGLPHSVLVDKQGIIRADFDGPRDWMSSDILKQIQEPLG